MQLLDRTGRLFLFELKGCFSMIPCRKNCAEYYEGCHKNCERWKEFLYQSSIERKEKKAYLDNYNQLCSTVVRQCLANTPHFYRV